MFGDNRLGKQRDRRREPHQTEQGRLFEQARAQIDVVELRAVHDDGLLQERFGQAIAGFDQVADLRRLSTFRTTRTRRRKGAQLLGREVHKIHGRDLPV
jgi:hypothetical protein